MASGNRRTIKGYIEGRKDAYKVIKVNHHFSEREKRVTKIRVNRIV